MSKNNDAGGGYGKPPHHSRWKKGQSGNPKGRPKKDRSLDYISHEQMRKIIISAGLQPIEVTENGVKRMVPKLHVIAKQMTNRAAAGDMRATAQYLRFIETATREIDQVRFEWITSWGKLQAEILDVQNKKGTLEHYGTMRRYYMFKRDMRRGEGVERWPYEPEEPVTTEDWVLFINHYEALKQGRTRLAPWPLDYPSDNMSKRELEYLAQLELEEQKNKNK